MMSDRVDPHRTAIKGRQTSARRVAADLWLTAIFGRHDRTSQLRDLGLLENEAPRFSDISRPEKRAARLSGRMCNGSRSEVWLDRRVKTSIDFAVHEKEDDHDGAGPRQADVADRCLGNVGHSGSDFVPLAVQGRRASRLSGGPSCAVSQGGSRSLAGATS